MSSYPYLPEKTEFDLLVIGGGINGAAIARDAAMRGLRVLLTEKSDFGSGTTSWSTRLIHGGLRYLEHYEVPLVRESLRERKILLESAPHLVHPLHFLIPIYSGTSRGPGIVRVGMLAYEALSIDKPIGHHKMLSAEETLHVAPGLEPAGLRAGALYFDAQATYAERLVMENILAAREYGALVQTYTPVVGFEVSRGRVTGVTVQHGQTGRHETVRAAVVINAAGPWVDNVLAGFPGDQQRLVGGTKGSHLVVAPFPGAPEMAVYTEALDNRPYFIVPWADNYLIGTTDDRYDGDLDDVAATDDEIDYLIESTNRAIPAANLRREHVLWSYAGIRPLPYEPGVSEAKVTRKHVFRTHSDADNFISVVGGKLTTHRALADQAVDIVYQRLGRRAPRCRTGEEPLPGGRVKDWTRFTDGFRAYSGLPEPVAEHLLSVYGVRALDVLDFAGQDARLRSTLTGTNVLAAEIPFAIRQECATTLADVYLRRTMLGIRGDLGLGTLGDAAEIMHTDLGWNSDKVGAEISNYEIYLEHFHRGQVSSRLVNV